MFSDLLSGIVGIISNAINAIKTWFQEIIVYIVDFFFDSIIQVYDFCLDFIIWFLDSVLSFFSSFGFDTSSAWVQVPAQSIGFLHQLGITSVVSILLGAMLVRVVLNLIPSWLSRI